jgi:hypothetical protein
MHHYAFLVVSVPPEPDLSIPVSIAPGAPLAPGALPVWLVSENAESVLVLSDAALLALFPLHAAAAIAIAKANRPVLNEFFMLIYFLLYMVKFNYNANDCF